MHRSHVLAGAREQQLAVCPFGVGLGIGGEGGGGGVEVEEPGWVENRDVVPLGPACCLRRASHFSHSAAFSLLLRPAPSTHT